MHTYIHKYIQDKIGTANNIVAESIRTGEPKGYDFAEAKRPKTEAEVRCEQLTVSLALANEENSKLVGAVCMYECVYIQTIIC